jgi:hypothetical protein
MLTASRILSGVTPPPSSLYEYHTKAVLKAEPKAALKAEPKAAFKAVPKAAK